MRDTMTHYSQCLFYSLDRWAHEGGSILFTRSLHWCVPHVMHRANNGQITHFLPPHDLTASWHSLFGYFGTVERFEDLERPPIKPLCMFFGSVALVVLGGWWSVKRAFTFRPIP